MKIGIDISPVIYETGVSVYLRELVRKLLEIDRENQYVLFGGSLRRKADLERFLGSLRGNFISKIYPIAPLVADFVWNRLHILEIERLIGEIDVFHSSDWTQPPSKAFKVTTVHDLSALRYPRLTARKTFDVQGRRLRRVKEEVDRIIVPSESTKNDLIEYGITESKIKVIHEAAGEEFSPKNFEEVNRIKAKYGIRRKYILTIGVGGRKNTERLIKAFELAKAGEELNLVLVGRPTKKFHSGRSLTFLGHIESSDLPALLTGAEVFAYPSLYEGFGLPVLQAFATGSPVVTSNTSSLPEVAGKAAVLVDPTDVNSIAEGIKKALRGKIGLVKSGFAQAARFSWEKTAEETLKVYEEAEK